MTRKYKEQSALFDPIIHDSVAALATTRIEEMILNGVLREGQRLPSERDLADQLAISRPKLREALKTLETLGLLRISAGDGIYVAKLGAEAMSPALVELYKRHPSAIDDNLEYRRVQEGFAASLAATRGTESDHTAIKRNLAAMEEAHAAGDNAASAELDVAFHQAVIFASHNRTLIQMMTSLYQLQRSSVFFNREELMKVHEVSGTLLDQHRMIGDAICAKQADQAEAAAVAHIDFIRQLVAEALEYRARENIAARRLQQG